jgi:CDP-diglyceride synthetase
MATIWICDSVAMAIGKRIGGAKLAPSVSPEKPGRERSRAFWPR